MKFNILAILFSCCVYAATAQITVYDINKTGPYMSSYPAFLTEFDDRLYLIATDSIHGYELWGIDSVTGEFLVADINPGPAGIIPGKKYPSAIEENFAKMAVTYVEALNKDAMFFTADDGIHGNELYRYDGINSPVMIKEFVPGPLGLNEIYNMTAINEFIFFHEYNKGIWQYNIHSGDAKLLPNTDYSSSRAEMVHLKGKLYTTFHRGNYGGYVLWEYDPATGDTAIIDTRANVAFLTVIANKLYYLGGKNTLFEYDGTQKKTIATFVPGRAWPIGEYKGKIYFPGPGRDIYSYDPVSGKKALVIHDDFLGSTFHAHGFIEFRGKMYFSARDSISNFELWEWDGVNQPVLTANLNPAPSGGGYPYNFHVIGDGLYFVATSGESLSGHEVHRYKPFPATVQNLSFKGEVRAYPNPVTSATTLELQLHSAQTLSVELYNTEGRKLLSLPQVLYSQGTSRVELDMHNLPSGNYFYHVRNQDNRTMVSGKLVKL